MSWGSPLIAALATPPYSWAWIIRVYGVLDSPGLTYAATTMPFGDAILGKSVVVNGPRLQPGSWTSTLGTITVELDGDLSTIKSKVTRGTFVKIQVGRPEWAESDYEIVGYGQVQSLTGKTPTKAVLTIRDFLSALRSRPTTSVGYLPLGYRLGSGSTAVATALTAAYTPGDSTVHVASTSGFSVGANGSAFLITPTTGDPFILIYNGTGAGTLTGCSASGYHNTTEVAAASGDKVQPLLWVNGHPLYSIRTVLLSVAGASTHGYDVLPEGDGLSLPYALVDHTDTNAHYTASEPGMSWQLVSDVPIDDPIGWINGWMSAGGFYLTIRQGLLTARSAQSPNTSSFSNVTTITDDDIAVGGASWEAWDSDSPVEAVTVVAESNDSVTSTSGAEANATLPAINEVRYDLKEYVFGSAGTQTTARDSIVDRVWYYHQRIPEKYTFVCVGLRLAVLAPGDFVLVTTRQIAGRLASTLSGLSGIRALVTQVSTDWGRGTVTLVCLIYPSTGDQFP